MKKNERELAFEMERKLIIEEEERKNIDELRKQLEKEREKFKEEKEKFKEEKRKFEEEKEKIENACENEGIEEINKIIEPDSIIVELENKEDDELEVPLEKLNKKELLEICENEGIEVNNSLGKECIINCIKLERNKGE